MSSALDPNLLVVRTCTTRELVKEEREHQVLASFRSHPAYVLLGDPGAGKTKSFEKEAEAEGGHYVRARSFATLEPGPELAGKTLFIDGLDEMRAAGGDGRTPLDHVRRHLVRLGRPKFRLSCREADWYGDSDSSALMEVSSDGRVTVLHLDPLTDHDVRLLLERKYGISNSDGFIEKAQQHRLEALLRNPQTLSLLANAVGDEEWPASRSAVYNLACQHLARENNSEHRIAKRNLAPTTESILDAAGFLCAVHLIAGIAGFALDEAAADSQHTIWRELVNPKELPLVDALASNLFKGDELEQQRIPVHRSIAEFLGARYLSDLVDMEGLPLGRIIALTTGEDGGIVPDLRGLAAWLTVHSRSARTDLIKRDPLGIVLYGDVADFSTESKRHVMKALKEEAEQFAHFRFQDWTAAPFGNLATPDMVPVFIDLLASPLRAKSDIALLDCALDALEYGPSIATLESREEVQRLPVLLETVVRDGSYPSHIRQGALKVLLRNRSINSARMVTIANDIHVGRIKDEEDQLLGSLLKELFPVVIGPLEIFNYLHPARKDRFIGAYEMFWRHELPKRVPVALLPEMLDQVALHAETVQESLDDYQTKRMVGHLLVRAIEEHGDIVDDARLYTWLSAGLDKYKHSNLDEDDQLKISAWITSRPDRYKSLLLTGIEKCQDSENVQTCLFKSSAHLYRSEPSSDIVAWCLKQAETTASLEIGRHYFYLAVANLKRQAGQDDLTLDAIEFLEKWVKNHDAFAGDFQTFVSCDLNHWQRENAASVREHKVRRAKQREEWRNYFREHIEEIRSGTAHPKNFHDLAQVYLRQFLDIEGETPHERLADFLDDDEELIAAAYAGFRRSLEREDLPSVEEIIDLEVKGRMHYIRQACLAGMSELFANDPNAAMHLNDELLRKLIAFRFTFFSEKEPEWFTALVKTRSSLVAEVLVAYVLPLLRNGKEHPQGIWQLASDESYSEVARIALPDLLQGFPLRAKNKQLENVLDPLLRAGLINLDGHALTEIISARLVQPSMSAAQRVYWLTCGLLLSPKNYEGPLSKHIGSSKALRGHLGAFLSERRPKESSPLPESSLALLVELLAPACPPERPEGAHWVSPAIQTAEVVRHYIDLLGASPSEASRQQLERLLKLPALESWHDHMKFALQTQRIARRKAEFQPATLAEVCHTLTNREPANAADLAALTDDFLRDLARKIRDGSTNDYRQYWSFGKDKKPANPKPENDCRDILLSDLIERVGRLGIEAVKEGYYVEDKRADIRVSYGGAAGFNVPIEIKKDSHADLWRAMHEQLIAHYTRDPGAEGFGIYLVFWFGGEGMPLPQEGRKPRSAQELENHLRATLTDTEQHLIRICVVDCSLPN
jgi:hypothetical protein